MTFRDDILPELDDIRGIPGELGMRLFTVTVLSRTWVGPRVGLSTSTDASTTLAVSLGSFNARVRGLTSKDVIASGGLYTSEDLRVGPFTPPFLGSEANGTEISIFDPTPDGNAREVFFKVTGPGYPDAGAWFKKVGQDTLRPFQYTLTLRKTAKVPVAVTP